MNRIEFIDINTIKEYDNNIKKHPQFQIKRLSESIKQFGFTHPIIIDENKVILAGHGRYLAAKYLEMKEVPIITIDNLDENKKKAYRIVDNKIQMETDQDIEIMKKEYALVSKEMSEKWNIDYFSDLDSQIEDILKDYRDEDKDVEESKKNKKTYTCPKCGIEFEV